MMSSKPSLFIFTGCHEHTGALVASYREALLLSDVAEVTLVLSDRSRIQPSQLPGSNLLHLPLALPSWRALAIYPFSLLRSGFALRRALKRHKCQRLQVNDYFFMEGAVARLLGFRGKIATWIRIDPAVQGRTVPAIWLHVARAISDELVTVSRHLRSRLPENIDARIVYDPVPDVQPLAAMTASSRRFVFFGNFIEGKGQDLAIRAFARIAGAYPKAELVFYGSTMGLDKNRRYLDKLKDAADRTPVAGQISFNGFVDNVPEALSVAFAALSLSRSESFSLTCQEASTHGLPVIATNSGGPAEIIDDGNTGFLVPVDDELAVADRMERLLRDPDEAREMGRRGAKLMQQRFPTEAFKAAVQDIFSLSR